MPKTCEVCESVLFPWHRVKEYRYFRCRSCGHISLDQEHVTANVAALYGDEYFSGGGAGYADYTAEHNILREHGRFYGRLLNKFAAPGNVLDVGAAAGFILRGLSDVGWAGVGLEPNERMATMGREALGLDVRVGALEDFHDATPFDAITMLQVVAHLRDLDAAFANAAAATQPGGLWVIETWDADSITARLLGEHWHELSPPTVSRIFTRRSLTLAAMRFGFRIVRSGRPPKWIGTSHAKSLLAHKAREAGIYNLAHAMMKLVPDSLRIPYPFDDVFYAIYEKAQLHGIR